MQKQQANNIAAAAKSAATEYLESAKKLYLEIDTKNEQLALIRSISENTFSRDTSAVHVQTSHSPGDDVICIAMQLEEQLSKEVDALLVLYKKLLTQISLMPKATHRVILNQKYLLYKTNAQLAEAMGYSERHITRLLEQAVKEFEKLYFQIS